MTFNKLKEQTMKRAFPLLLVLTSSTAFAEETRQLDAHEHGVGTLNIAFEGKTIAMEFMAPGADIVGFEYEAKSAEDRSAIENALAVLAKPSDLFVLPAAAECTVKTASAALESEDEQDDHDDHGDHAKHDDDHEDHAEHKHDEDHDDHAKHDDDHEEHAEHKHDEDHDDHAKHDDHEEHAEEAGHTEFHAEYTLTCANPEAISEVTFAYFDAFENAREVEVQVVTASGAKAFEVEKDAPLLDLRGLF